MFFVSYFAFSPLIIITSYVLIFGGIFVLFYKIYFLIELKINYIKKFRDLNNFSKIQDKQNLKDSLKDSSKNDDSTYNFVQNSLQVKKEILETFATNTNISNEVKILLSKKEFSFSSTKDDFNIDDFILN
jgi:hypothetical protein